MTKRTIAHVDAERGFSGGEAQVFLLMEGLRERGHRNVLFCPPGSAAEQEASRRDFEVRPVAMRGDVDLLGAISLARGFRSLGPELVHLHTGRAAWLGGIAAWLAGTPSVVRRRMDGPVRRTWKNRLVYGAFSDAVVAISHPVARCLVDGGVDRERVRVVHSSVRSSDLATGERATTRTELGLADGELCVLTLASLVERKGIDVLLDAFAGLAPELRGRTRLIVAGEGPEGGPLRRRAEERGLAPRVAWLGRRDDTADLLAAADVFVLASRQEGLGVAALEAMAAGLPVVATRVGGLGEAVVDGETGLLVKPDDAGGLGAALERMLGDPELRESCGRAGRRRVRERYDAAAMVAAYEELYGEVLARRDAGGRR